MKVTIRRRVTYFIDSKMSNITRKHAVEIASLRTT